MFYQKYRPRKFSELIGQELIVKILQNFLKDVERLPQAYLFAGPKGTGKTSTARIFAKTLNCLDIDQLEPCDQCLNCQAINQNRFMDLIEIDAASHSGVDEIRNIKDNIGFRPIQGRFKVLIIDEAHMLSQAAGNALLKLLEEPPKHAIFIFATTEPEKILPTILSRIQRFDFQRATLTAIIRKLELIARAEKISADEKVLALIATESGAAFRDAEALLERIVLSLGDNEKLNGELVEKFLGKLSSEKILDFIAMIFENKSEAAIKFIQSNYENGFDLSLLTRETIKFLREILILKVLPSWLNQLNHHYSAEIVGRLEKIAAKIDLAKIRQAIKVMIEAEFFSRDNLPVPTLALEIAVIDLIKTE